MSSQVKFSFNSQEIEITEPTIGQLKKLCSLNKRNGDNIFDAWTTIKDPEGVPLVDEAGKPRYIWNREWPEDLENLILIAETGREVLEVLCGDAVPIAYGKESWWKADEMSFSFALQFSKEYKAVHTWLTGFFNSMDLKTLEIKTLFFQAEVPETAQGSEVETPVLAPEPEREG